MQIGDVIYFSTANILIHHKGVFSFVHQIPIMQFNLFDIFVDVKDPLKI